ncbi:discoidin domain-containing protein [Paractinoplanes durhamensis]
MGPSPSAWGSGTDDVPPSITTGSTTPRPLTDRLTGGTLTASGENAPNEARAAAADDTSLTKWLTFTNTATLEYALPATAAVQQYTLTSANDVPGRDPQSWTLQGSTNGTTWTTLDTRTGIDFSDRRQTRAFVIPNSTAYARYRLQITANHGAAETQLAEWELLA